jgi:hypothetical protein
MPHREVSTLSKRVTILIGLGVVCAMAFGLSISFYRNLLFEETLETLVQRNRALRGDIDNGLESLAYYRSLQYRDKYAKENLGLLNPGEKVLILSEDNSPIAYIEEDTLTRSEERKAAYRQYLESIPTLEHWRLYLFDPEGLSKLKQSF